MKLMNKSELATFFDVSLTTINNWMQRGCPFVSKGRNGKSWKFNLKEVVTWREENLTGGQNKNIKPDLPEGFSGNGFIDFYMMAAHHLIPWIIDRMAPTWAGNGIHLRNKCHSLKEMEQLTI